MAAFDCQFAHADVDMDSSHSPPGAAETEEANNTLTDAQAEGIAGVPVGATKTGTLAPSLLWTGSAQTVAATASPQEIRLQCIW